MNDQWERDTDRIVQLGYPPVCDRKAGEEDEIDKGMDVAFFSEVEV
jgi:hypothetical protein